jgi:MFS transporter, DHA1 family, multidrug resistance protein
VSRAVRAHTLVLCALVGTAQMTWGVVVPLLPLYVEAFGLGVAALGPVVAGFAVGRILGNVPAGLLLRRLRPRRVLWTAALALCAITAATGWAPDEVWLIGMRVLAGILGGAVVTVGFAVLVAGAPADARGSVMATATVVQMSAAAAGSLLGGVVVEAAGIPATFVVAALPLALCLVWETVRPARAYWAAFATPAAGTSVRRGLRATDAAMLLALCGVSFSTFFARFAGEQGLVPVLAYDVAGMSPVGLGVAMAAGTVASLAVMPLVGRWIDRGARGRLLLPAGAVGAGALALLPGLAGPLPFSVALVAYAVATSVVGVVPGVVMGERFGPREAGAVVGLTRTVGDAGAAIGPLVVFPTAAIVGTWAAAGVLALVLLAAIMAFAAVTRRGPAPDPEVSIP